MTSILSITIRPPQNEFIRMKNPLDLFLEYISPDDIVVGIEMGAQNKANHYQIYLKTGKNINTIRKKINILFKPHLSPLTLKCNKWRRVSAHDGKVSLLGYVQKEGNIYFTNIESALMKAELIKYAKQTNTIQKMYCVKHGIKVHPVYHHNLAVAEICVSTCGNLNLLSD